MSLMQILNITIRKKAASEISVALFSVLLLTGSLSAQNESVMPPSDSTILPAPAETTLIEDGDVLEIVVLGEEELSRTCMVMHTGNISFPLIGDVKAAGLTTSQAANLISSRLKTFFTRPVISVILKSPSTPHVSVFGYVPRPGALEYQRGLRVADYIALAGGAAPSGNLDRVKVVRFSHGRSSVETVNVSDIIRHGESDRNFTLKSGDWLYVPYRFRLNWSTVLQTATLTVTLLNLYIILKNIR
jgi:polysaccharide export outer membrane protein